MYIQLGYTYMSHCILQGVNRVRGLFFSFGAYVPACSSVKLMLRVGMSAFSSISYGKVCQWRPFYPIFIGRAALTDEEDTAFAAADSSSMGIVMNFSF
jgi:hypothetical protein